MTLQKCKVESKRKRDRARLFLKRSDLAKSVKECSSKLAAAVQQFAERHQVARMTRVIASTISANPSSA